MLSIMRTFRKLSADSTLPNRPLHSDHEDRPGYMLANNLKQIADEASQLARVTTDKDNAEPWVESKIDRAAQAVDNVHDYAKYKTKSAAYSLGSSTALHQLGVSARPGTVIKQALFQALANTLVGGTPTRGPATPAAPAAGGGMANMGMGNPINRNPTPAGQAPSALSNLAGALGTVGKAGLQLADGAIKAHRESKIDALLSRNNI